VFLYDRTILAPFLAQFVRALPIATLIVWHALRTIPREQLDAAEVDGAGTMALWLRVVLPQRKAALAVAWLSAFALATGDLAASILVVPPGVTTLSIRIFGLIHYGIDDQVAGVALFVALLCGGGWLASLSLLNKKDDWATNDLGADARQLASSTTRG